MTRPWNERFLPEFHFLHVPGGDEYAAFYWCELCGDSCRCLFRHRFAGDDVVGVIMFHVVIVSLLSNIGKLCPMFFYRDRKLSERLALSIGMFTRGEVGAGIIFIALGYNLGGPALVISVLTLVLNLILTGIFVLWVKNLALRSYTN